MMTFTDLLKNRRSIRDFQDKNVPMNLIEEILQESTLAPSASNNQPCRFSIVHCRKTIKALSDESKANLLEDYAGNKKSLLPQYIDMLKDENFNVFYNAPCVIFIIGSKSVKSLDVDCALAASYIMFSAVERGLGTCWSIWDPTSGILSPGPCWPFPTAAGLSHRLFSVIQRQFRRYPNATRRKF
jgi:nitroreductase